MSEEQELTSDQKALLKLSVDQLKALIDKNISDNVQLSESQKVIGNVAAIQGALKTKQCEEVSQYAILKLKTRVLQFDEYDALFKRSLAEVQYKDPEEAAKTLQSINLEQTNRVVSYREKAETWMQIAEYWFEAEDSVNAEKFINKAAHIMHHVEVPKGKDEAEKTVFLTLQVQYKSFQAKLLDSKRKFNLAAWEYYKLSNIEKLDAEDVVAQLSAAITCAILSPAGDSKYRIMSVLHKDERSKSIDPHYGILDKLFMGHIIKESDVAAYEADLEDHQKARGEDGSTVLARALLEHNILVLSKIYLNITFGSLGKFLNIPAEKAEQIISEMVREKRIEAQLDQMTQTVDFEVQMGAKAVQLAGTTRAKPEGEKEEKEQMSDADRELHDFNKSIHGVCANIDSLISDILKEHPDLQKYDTHVIA